MTDTQLLTLALALIVPLSLLIYSNSRISEAKETLRAEMKAMTAEIATGLARMTAEIQGLRAELKIHELEHHHK
jgi:hypothetical protein